MEPVLVIMAAGLGSRFGGLKQMEPMDAEGDLIIDFSVFDAIRAGFKKVVFIVKETNIKDFRETIGRRVSPYIETEYVIQDVADLPEGYELPEGRVKPWGTGHALYACRKAVDAPFAVINADDYYGPDAFRKIYQALKDAKDDDFYRFHMISYRVENTVTDKGSVSRGVCSVDNGELTAIVERTRIEKREGGAAFTEDDGATWSFLSGETPVSMNFWGFTTSYLRELEKRFPVFLDGVKTSPNPLKAEFYLPFVVDELIREGLAKVTVQTSTDRWYGVTYREDKETVVQAIADFKKQGLYPEKLWDR